jgi:hypothetical protein
MSSLLLSDYFRTCHIPHIYIYEIFLSQRPRKSPPAVMFTSRETPCISQVKSFPGTVHVACEGRYREIKQFN